MCVERAGCLKHFRIPALNELLSAGHVVVAEVFGAAKCALGHGMDVVVIA